MSGLATYPVWVGVGLGGERLEGWNGYLQGISGRQCRRPMASIPHLVGTAYHPESGTARRNKASDLSIGSVRRRQLLPPIRRVGGQD